MTAPDWRATYARERAKRVARIRADQMLEGGQGRTADGFATERKLAGAIRRKRNTNAPRRKIDEQAYGVQGRGPDAEDFEGADR